MKLAAKSLSALLEDFRSSAPTPGGGSASALAGAVGASLLAMVAGLPRPRASTEPDLQTLREAGGRCTVLATQLETLIDRDSDAYELVVGAYRMPKGTDEEKVARATRIQEALKTAIEAPLDVMRTCAAGIAEGPALLELGNPNASSDVRVGLEMLRAGLRGARLNVDINLGSVEDREYAATVVREIDRLVSESGAATAPNASA